MVLLLVCYRQIHTAFVLDKKKPSRGFTSKRGCIMQDAALLLLASWHNFYAILGTAAATLTGLMFVVITINARDRNRGASDGIGAFGTPNVFHFEMVLLVAAILSAPWPLLWNVDLCLGLCG